MNALDSRIIQVIRSQCETEGMTDEDVASVFRDSFTWAAAELKLALDDLKKAFFDSFGRLLGLRGKV